MVASGMRSDFTTELCGPTTLYIKCQWMYTLAQPPLQPIVTVQYDVVY